MFEKILEAYGIDKNARVELHGKGLINRTWSVKAGEKEFILQQINQQVFSQPGDIAENMELLSGFLSHNHPDYFLPLPLQTVQGRNMYCDKGSGYYRVFPFVKDSVTHHVLQSTSQAYEAARQFGIFAKKLSDLPITKLRLTLPGFHDLSKRYKQLEHACRHGSLSRIRQAEKEIAMIREHADILESFHKIKASKKFRVRAMHHDTKISNVLFNKSNKGVCVIDLDTVMPGFFISDAGDMLRTYLSPAGEEEKDLSAIEAREEYFKAILEGYLSAMGDELNETETEHFIFAGKFMILMQAIRFLADHLNKDVYYGASYEDHNYIRARNQLALLQSLESKEEKLIEITRSAIKK